MYVYTYATCVLFLLNVILVTVADDDSKNGLSTGAAVAISIVITFIITLVVTALVSVIITSLYYKHLIGKIHKSEVGNKVKKVDPLYQEIVKNQNGH